MHYTRKTKTQQQSQEYGGLRQHLTGRKHSFFEMLEESRAVQAAAGPESDRLRQGDAEPPREGHHNNDRAKFDALLLRNRTNLESHESRTSEGQEIIRELRSEGLKMRASAVPPNLTRDLEAKIECQKHEGQSL